MVRFKWRLIILLVFTFFCGALLLFWIQSTLHHRTLTPTFKESLEISALKGAEEENERRRKKIRETCKKYNLGRYKNYTLIEGAFKYPPAPQYAVFYYDLKDKLSYCPIYKAGSTTWLYNLIELAGVNDETVKSSKEQLSTIARRLYPELEYERAVAVLENSAKLLVVRHPFERLLSAYRDKLENINIGQEHGTGHFYKKYGAKIVKKFRKGPVDKNLYFKDRGKPPPSGKEPTFSEFTNYLIHSDLLNYADDHWIPFNLFCTPCWVEYDYVSKTETMNDDQQFLIEREGLTKKISPKWRHRTRASNTSQEDISKFYFSQLTRKDVIGLFEKFKLDFEMFEYSPAPYLNYSQN